MRTHLGPWKPALNQDPFIIKNTLVIAHFAICFLVLLTFKILKKLINHYAINNLIKQLQVMTVTPISAGIVHTNYEGSQLLQVLDKAFGNRYLMKHTNTKI